MKFAASSSGGLLVAAHLSSHHRDTIDKIFSHPASGSVEWREVLSLLEYLGTTTEEHNGKFRCAVGSGNRGARRCRIPKTLMRR
jgi:hypothetical protein